MRKIIYALIVVIGVALVVLVLIGERLKGLIKLVTAKEEATTPPVTSPTTPPASAPIGGEVNQYGYFVPTGGWGFTDWTSFITQEEASEAGGWSQVEALKELARKKGWNG